MFHVTVSCATKPLCL